jgi:hypothetical protein
MNPIESNSQDLSGVGWQVLGGIELTLNSNVEDEVRAWLAVLLLPLLLDASFLNKVLRSAQEYSLRALRSTTDAANGHVHLVIFVQQDRTMRGESWGFFRIEKIDSAEHKASHPDHIVEFYLYLDGQ